MTMSDTTTRTHLTDEAVSLLCSLLLCQLAVHADQAAECRATADGLTGQMDSDSLLERELAETSATSSMVALLETREALRRLDEGAYGLWEACSTPIPFERLEALPHARRCVSYPAAPAGLVG